VSFTLNQLLRYELFYGGGNGNPHELAFRVSAGVSAIHV
jgi:hypothetical protein